MPYLSNSRQMEESWTTNLAWRLGNPMMPRGLKLINDIIATNTICFERSLDKLVSPQCSDTMVCALGCSLFLIYGLLIVQIYLNMV
jgi:hypothetical protein